MTGGYAAKSAGILSRAKEIDALKAEAKGLQEQMARLDGELKALQAEAAELRAVAAGIDGELKTAQEDKIRYESEKKRLDLAYEEAVRVKEQAALEYDQLTARLEELKGQNVSNSELLGRPHPPDGGGRGQSRAAGKPARRLPVPRGGSREPLFRREGAGGRA